MVAEVEEWCGGRYVLVEVMSTLPGRGEGAFTKCVRMSPERDLTNGFFVACFQRTSAGGNKHLKSTHVVDRSDNRGDIQCDNSRDIQGDENGGGHRNVPKKRRGSKHLKSTRVVDRSDNRGDIQCDNSCDIQEKESAGGHQDVPKKRRASNIPVNPPATKKRKTRRKRKRNGKSVTAEA